MQAFTNPVSDLNANISSAKRIMNRGLDFDTMSAKDLRDSFDPKSLPKNKKDITKLLNESDIDPLVRYI